MEDSSTFKLKLPGFRFHPTEEELLSFYLKKMIFQKEPRVNVIGFLNIYRHDPWDLPGLAKTQIGEREWYFFVPRDRKNGNGGRPNRTTEKGFWKATGSDRKVISLSDPKKMIGLKKTLVFYKGRAPRGCKTDWIMNEFRLPDTCPSPKDIVLCKIYRKATSLKALEQRATTEEVPSKTSPMLLSPPITRTPSSSSLDDGHQFYSDTLYRKETSLKALEQRATTEEVPSKTSPMLLSPPITRTPSPSSLDDGHQFYSDTHHRHYQYINGQPNMLLDCRVKGASDIHSLTFDSKDTVSKAGVALKEEKREQVVEEDDLILFGIQNKKIAETKTNTSIQLPFGQEKLPELLVSKSSVDWTQDPFWTQLRSPWLDDWAFYANALNF